MREPVVYDEAFQLVQEGVAWFGPELHLMVQVMPQAGEDTGCNAGGAGSGGAACAMLLLGVFAGRRRFRADRRRRL